MKSNKYRLEPGSILMNEAMLKWEKDKERKKMNSFHGWCKIIKNISMRTRDPMWEGAIEYLVSEGVMGPTMQHELSQGQIQEMILEQDGKLSIHELFIDFGEWMMSAWGEARFYVVGFTSGPELWLAFLMGTRYALEWDGERWANIDAPGCGHSGGA